MSVRYYCLSDNDITHPCVLLHIFISFSFYRLGPDCTFCRIHVSVTVLCYNLFMRCHLSLPKMHTNQLTTITMHLTKLMVMVPQKTRG
uniref:Uncharacterized protein n=2 Tax=Anguilla anguilla TaxID=7936 RepID=A0A0E9Q6H8_ANGAN